ncbi:hypothetical protein [Streptomyces sp. NPDC001435]|uniref:hypothetical protein n=1 Tax=unclassified Streptomyces TaxID=2593676 RepID=UPI0036CCE338
MFAFRLQPCLAVHQAGRVVAAQSEDERAVEAEDAPGQRITHRAQLAGQPVAYVLLEPPGRHVGEVTARLGFRRLQVRPLSAAHPLGGTLEPRAVFLYFQQAVEQVPLEIDPGLHRLAIAELLNELSQGRLHRLMARVHHHVVGIVGVGVEQAHPASVTITTVPCCRFPSRRSHVRTP